MVHEYADKSEAAAHFIRACFWLGKYMKNAGGAEIDSMSGDFCEDFRVAGCAFLSEDRVMLDSNALAMLECRGEGEHVIFRDAEESIVRRYQKLLSLEEAKAVRGSVLYYTTRLRD